MHNLTTHQARARARRILEAKANEPATEPETTGAEPDRVEAVEAAINEFAQTFQNLKPTHTHARNRKDRRPAQRPQSPAEAELWAEKGIRAFQRGPRAIERYMDWVDIAEGNEPELQGPEA